MQKSVFSNRETLVYILFNTETKRIQNFFSKL